MRTILTYGRLERLAIAANRVYTIPARMARIRWVDLVRVQLIYVKPLLAANE